MKRLIIVSFLSCLIFTLSAQSVAEMLGYKADDRLLIINNDDAGMCHAANVATIANHENGLLSSSTIMVTCPWYSEIAEYARNHPDKGFGVHLTLTAEWKYYRWKPLLSKEVVPGLYEPDGYLWRSVQEVYKASNPNEALLEGRAQIQRAIDDGIPLTHIDSHMGTYQYDLAWQQVYMQLALEFNLPLRMPSQLLCAMMGFPKLRADFAEKGLVFPDYLVMVDDPDYDHRVKEYWMETLKNLPAGITELFIHGTIANDESRAITSSADTRNKEFETFMNDQDIRKLIEDKGIIIISYKQLRDLQRKNTTGSHP
jgi:predicted glycoside hydrolase/deacetylase ChbG (UPF0249 family)